MTFSAFLVFVEYDSSTLATNEVPLAAKVLPVDPFPTPVKPAADNFFPIASWDLSSLQTLNIGSQSSGAGAGKISFNPLTVVRDIDKFSQILFLQSCSGTPFEYVDLLIERNGSAGYATHVHLAYRFGLCAVKSIDWSAATDTPTPREIVTFEYGQLTTAYAVQHSKGTVGPFTFKGWDRVRNVAIPSP